MAAHQLILEKGFFEFLTRFAAQSKAHMWYSYLRTKIESVEETQHYGVNNNPDLAVQLETIRHT